MKAKLGTAAILLVSALAFGGTGVFATYEIVTMLYDGVRARDWTAVQAAAGSTARAKASASRKRSLS